MHPNVSQITPPEELIRKRSRHRRAAPLKDRKAYVQAGGGWANDSTPEGEFQETVNKSRAMLKAMVLAECFSS
jgi:anthranilate/para-aminobenzoate synthase component I